MSKIDEAKVIEIVENILGTSDRIEIDLNDPRMAEISGQILKSRMRLAMSIDGSIAVDIHKDGTTITFNRIGSVPIHQTTTPTTTVPASKPKKMPAPKRHQHTYVPSEAAKDVMSALLDDASHVIWFKGPTGTGKTVMVEYLARELGYELHKVNCNGAMGPDSFFGDKTVEVDEKTGQNHIVFKDGPVVNAMLSGLDADGNEDPDAKPGLLFIDEAGSIPAHIGIGLNHLLESDDPRRTITLTGDAGRVVRSHSKFRIILAANTAGRGATDMSESMYTAQMDALDISLLNRIALTFKFGYDRNVEKHIAMQKIGDDKVVAQVLKFRDAVRENMKAGKGLTTPFSTRHIVKISDAYRIYGNIAKAIYYTTFEQLLPEEKATYNELAVAQLGVDILKKFVTSDIDYV